MKRDEIKTGVILSYASMAVQALTLLFYTPIMLRVLGKSEYGLYEIANSTISYLSLLSFGFGSSYARFYFRYKVKEDKKGIANLNGMFLILFGVIFIITIIAGGFLIGNIELVFNKSLTPDEIQLTKKLMVFMVINIAVTFPNSVWDANLTVLEKYTFQKGLSLLQAILNPFIALPLLLIGYKSIAIVFVTTTLTLGKFFINGWYCLKKTNMKFSFLNMKWQLFKELGIFSFYIFLNMVVDQVNWAVDKFLLGIMQGAAAVAVYGLASQINQSYITLSTSISNVFIPRVNKLVFAADKDDELTELFVKIGRVQFLVLSMILGGFIVLGKFFIVALGGEEYAQAYYIVILLISAVTIPLIQNIGIEIQKAKNMHKFRSGLYAVIAGTNVVMSIFLIRIWGATGAAFGTALSLLIGNGLVMNWYYYKKVNINVLKFWKNIIILLPGPILGVLISKASALLFPVNNIINFVIIGLVYVVVFAAVEWRFSLNCFEKQLVKGMLNKLKRK